MEKVVRDGVSGERGSIYSDVYTARGRKVGNPRLPWRCALQVQRTALSGGQEASESFVQRAELHRRLPLSPYG